jgi:hypothetical protein
MIEYQVSSATTEEPHFFTSGYFEIFRLLAEKYNMHCAQFFLSRVLVVRSTFASIVGKGCTDSSLLLIFCV